MEKRGELEGPLQSMQNGCGAGPDCKPPENKRWMIASKTHPAKVEFSEILWRGWCISRRCLIP